MRGFILFVSVLTVATALAAYALDRDVSAQSQSCSTSGSFTQGSKTCSINTDTKCGSVGCSPFSKGTCTVCDSTPPSYLLCESQVPSGCTVNTGIHCTDEKQASFGYHCSNDTEGVTTTEPIACPISCQNCSTTEKVSDSDQKCVACPSPKVAFQSQADDWRHCNCPEPAPTPNGRYCSWDSTNCRWICNIAGTCNGDSSSGCDSGLVDLGGYCGRSYQFQSRCADPSGYDDFSCTCPDGTTMSPIVIDVDHSGFSLTDASGGVVFNLVNDGVSIQISWTSRNSTNAFLALDRNGNGMIDSGAELFGNITPQPSSPNQNGFLALAEYDKAANGGNGNGRIDSGDAVFSQLRLWQDTNHDGISQPNELHTLPELGILAID